MKINRKKIRIIASLLVYTFLMLEISWAANGDCLAPSLQINKQNIDAVFSQLKNDSTGIPESIQKKKVAIASPYLNLEKRDKPVTEERLKAIGINGKTGRNWIWDSSTNEIREKILQRLSTIDKEALLRFVCNNALNKLNKKLPFGKIINQSAVKRIMFKGSYLNNPFEASLLFEDSLPTDIDMVVVLDSASFTDTKILLNFKIPESEIFLSGERGKVVRLADITFVAKDALLEDRLTYSLAAGGYTLMWGSAFEIFTTEDETPIDISASDDLILDKAVYLAEDGFKLVFDKNHLEVFDDGRIRSNKSLKRIIEVNYILKYLDATSEFGENEAKAIGDLLADYLKRRSEKVGFREESKRDEEAFKIFAQGFKHELGKILYKIDKILESGKITGVKTSGIKETLEKLRVSCLDDGSVSNFSRGSKIPKEQLLLIGQAI